MLSFDVIIWEDNTPFFIFPENFTHSQVMATLAKRKRTKASIMVFFDIEAKRIPSIVSKLFSKRSEHIR